jgi:hypothetical protein
MDGEIASESAPVDYIHWQDFCWSPGCRAWPEVWWVSFKTYITKEEAKEKWGKIAERMNYVAKTKRDERDNPSDQHLYAEVYEIWCKKNRCLYWFSKGVDRLLGKQSDPLKLREFWPCPRPMLANTTTSTLVPKADYIFAQDLYIQIDTLSTRLAMLAKAVKVVGVYDKSSSAVQRMLNEATENELIPVDNWAMFAEKGGLKGQVDWLPIEEIVKVMQTLAQVREQCIQLLYQVTGMSDILRGATDPRETKGAQELKSKYASIRIQAMQDLFAKFASDIQKIKAEIMVKHYQINSIITQSNIAFTPDAQYAQGAVALIKDPKNMIWRIQIRPESVAMVDYAQLKQERTEFLMASSQFMQSAAPLAQLDKSVTPTLLELLKWGLSGFKGAQQIEGALDKAIAQATEAMSKPPPPPPPDPKVEAAKIKAQTDQQLAQQEFQQKQMEFQQQMQQDQQKFQQEMIQMQKEFELKMRQAEMEIGIRREEAQLKAREQYVDAALNIEQQRETTEIQNTANREQHDMKMEQMRQKPKTNGGSG